MGFCECGGNVGLCSSSLTSRTNCSNNGLYINDLSLGMSYVNTAFVTSETWCDMKCHQISNVNKQC
jgi:hypothetical protein